MDRAIEGGRDKAAEQRMRLIGAALEFGVELRADEPGVALRLDDLDERAVGGETGEAHAGVREVVAEVVVELVAVAVALPDLGRVVERAGMSAMTGCAVVEENSALVASSQPSTWRANSMTAICMPRQMPR